MARRMVQGKLWLALFMSIQWVVVPMVSADTALPGANAAPQVLQDVGGGKGTLDELFPVTDVVITLEKQIPPVSAPTQFQWEGVHHNPHTQKPPSRGIDPVIDPRKAPEVISETAASTSFRAGHRTEAYEELDDPFASKEEIPELSDPFEGYNRFMFNFNDGLYEHVMDPVARGYRDFLHVDIRIAISNAFSNAMSPIKFASSLLQGDVEKTGRVLGRLIINTTIGLGGLFDVADKGFGIKSVNEDFDQTLGSYGIPTGPYVMLPLLGPSTLRNMAGRFADSFLDPTVVFSPGIAESVAISMGDTINDTSFIVDDIKQLDKDAIDKYESVRDFYHQYRFNLVNE